MHMNRKDFLKTSALASAGILSRPFITYGKASKYRVALIGCGWWGTNILREAVASGAVEVVAQSQMPIERPVCFWSTGWMRSEWLPRLA